MEIRYRRFSAKLTWSPAITAMNMIRLVRMIFPVLAWSILSMATVSRVAVWVRLIVLNVSV